MKTFTLSHLFKGLNHFKSLSSWCALQITNGVIRLNSLAAACNNAEYAAMNNCCPACISHFFINIWALFMPFKITSLLCKLCACFLCFSTHKFHEFLGKLQRFFTVVWHF